MNKKKIIIFIITIFIKKNIFSIFDIDYQAYEYARIIFNLTYQKEGKLDEQKFKNALNKKEYLKNIISRIYEDIYSQKASVINNYYEEIKNLSPDITSEIINIIFNSSEMKENKNKIVKFILENNKSSLEKNKTTEKDIFNVVNFFILMHENFLKFQKEIPEKNSLNFNNDLVIVDANNYSIITPPQAVENTVNKIPNNFEQYKRFKENIKFKFDKNIWETASCHNKEIEEIKKKLDSFNESHQKALMEKKTDCQKIYYELPRVVAMKLEAGKIYEIINLDFSNAKINCEEYLFYNENLELAWNNEENNNKEKKGILIFTTKENYSDLLEKFLKKNPEHIKNINKKIIFAYYDKNQNLNMNEKYIIDKNSFEKIKNNFYISRYLTSGCASLYDAFKKNKNAFEILGDNNFLNNAIKEIEESIQKESISELSALKSNEVAKKIMEKFINKIRCHNGLIILNINDIENQLRIALSQLPNLEKSDCRDILKNLRNTVLFQQYPFAKEVIFGNLSDYEEKKLLKNKYIKKIEEIPAYSVENINKSKILPINKKKYRALVGLQLLIPDNKKEFIEDIRNDKLNNKNVHINFKKDIEANIISKLLNMNHQEKEEFCRKNSYIFAPPLNPKSILRDRLSDEKLLSEGGFNESDIAILAESLNIDEEKAKKILINTLRHHVPKEAFANKNKVILYIIMNKNKKIKKEFKNYNTREKQVIQILERFKIEKNNPHEIDQSPQVSILPLLKSLDFSNTYLPHEEKQFYKEWFEKSKNGVPPDKFFKDLPSCATLFFGEAGLAKTGSVQLRQRKTYEEYAIHYGEETALSSVFFIITGPLATSYVNSEEIIINKLFKTAEEINNENPKIFLNFVVDEYTRNGKSANDKDIEKQKKIDTLFKQNWQTGKVNQEKKSYWHLTTNEKKSGDAALESRCDIIEIRNITPSGLQTHLEQSCDLMAEGINHHIKLLSSIGVNYRDITKITKSIRDLYNFNTLLLKDEDYNKFEKEIIEYNIYLLTKRFDLEESIKKQKEIDQLMKEVSVAPIEEKQKNENMFANITNNIIKNISSNFNSIPLKLKKSWQQRLYDRPTGLPDTLSPYDHTMPWSWMTMAVGLGLSVLWATTKGKNLWSQNTQDNMNTWIGLPKTKMFALGGGFGAFGLGIYFGEWGLSERVNNKIYNAKKQPHNIDQAILEEQFQININIKPYIENEKYKSNKTEIHEDLMNLLNRPPKSFEISKHIAAIKYSDNIFKSQFSLEPEFNLLDYISQHKNIDIHKFREVYRQYLDKQSNAEKNLTNEEKLQQKTQYIKNKIVLKHIINEDMNTITPNIKNFISYCNNQENLKYTCNFFIQLLLNYCESSNGEINWEKVKYFDNKINLLKNQCYILKDQPEVNKFIGIEIRKFFMNTNIDYTKEKITMLDHKNIYSILTILKKEPNNSFEADSFINEHKLKEKYNQKNNEIKSLFELLTLLQNKKEHEKIFKKYEEYKKYKQENNNRHEEEENDNKENREPSIEEMIGIKNI